MKDNRIRNLWKRMMAVLLTGVMLAGAVPVDVLAAVLSQEDVIRLEEEQGEEATEWQGEDEALNRIQLSNCITRFYKTKTKACIYLSRIIARFCVK